MAVPARLTPSERKLRAQLAAHESWARTDDPSARTAPARRAFLDRFERAANAGFEAVEFLFPYAHTVAEIKERLAEIVRWRKEHHPAGEGNCGSVFTNPPGDHDVEEPSGHGADDLAEWKTDSFRSYPTAIGTPGEQHMEWIEYTRYRDMYQFSTMRTSPGFPLWLTTNPDHSIAVWPLPNDAYTIRGEYYRAPSVLSADTDSPLSGGLPVRFHMLLVYMAMQSYAFFAAAPEVEARATSQRNRMLAKLDAWGLPTMEMAGPL